MLVSNMSVDTDVFLKNSTIEILIPKATSFEVEELSQCTDDVVSAVEKRSLLYFGMQRKNPVKAPSSYSFLGTC